MYKENKYKERSIIAKTVKVSNTVGINVMYKIEWVWNSSNKSANVNLLILIFIRKDAFRVTCLSDLRI